MAITLVDVGTTANDGTGDPLRTAFQTVNTALTRLDNTVDVQTGYVLLKDDSGSTGVAVTTAGNVGIGTTSPSTKLDVNGAATVSTSVSVAGRSAATFGGGVCSGDYFNMIRNSDGWLLRSSRSDSNEETGFYQTGHTGAVATDYRKNGVKVFSWESDGDFVAYLNDGTEAMRWDASTANGGRLGIKTTSPTEALDVNSDAVRIRSSQTPASASSTGDAGQICWDSNYIYVCTATNTWKRAALATW